MSAILYLLGTYPCWSETYLDQELKLLREAGLPVVPVALWRGEGPGASAADVHYLSSHSVPGPAARPSSVQALLPAAARCRLSRWRHRGLGDALARLARDLEATHLYAAVADLPALLAAGCAPRILHGYSVSAHARDVLCNKYGDNAIFGGARFVSVCNRRAYEALLRRSPGLGPCLHLIRHGLVPEQWPYSRTLFAPHSPLRLLFVGRLTEKKRPELAVAAVKQLQEVGIDCQLRVIGSGHLEAGLRSAAKTAGVASAIVWEGVLPRSEVARRMREADFLLLPSEERPSGDMEGVPNVMVEAMATGLPVVGTVSGSMGELLTTETGLVLAAWSDLPESIVTALNAPELVTAMIGRAREAVMRCFDARQLIERKAALLRRVVAEDLIR